jgi:hypothetical protein
MKRVMHLGAWTLAVWLACLATAAAQGRGTISGTVIGPDGKPQPNVTLIVTNSAGIDRRGVSEANGSYVFGGLLAGPYRLRVDDESGSFAPWSQDAIAVVGGQTVTIQITLAPRVAPAAAPTARATLAGTVIGPDGKPRGNVPVVLTNAAGVDRRAVTEPSGAYVFGGLQAGDYRVRVEEDFALPYASAALPLAPGEKRALDIRLQPLPAPPTPAAAPAAATSAAPAAPGGGAAQAPRVEQVRARPEGPASAVPETTFATDEFQAFPNRWEFEFPEMKRYQPPQDVPWVVGSPLDPYNQNKLKGDYPLGDNNLFMNLNMQANSALNPRSVAAGEPQGQVFLNNNFVAGFELFSGTTVFEPKRWAVRATIVANANRLAVEDLDSKGLTELGVEELFAEKRLAVLGPTFDFMTVRGGMQNFNSDFRGYLFVDNQLGVRLFGNARANRDQYNFAFFSMREREPVSQLHDFGSRNQNVFIANYFIQDFAGVHGYTGMFNVHVNADEGPEEDPVPLNVFYLGFHGDGKWGGWSVSHAYYEAFGSDDDNRIARTLNGGFAAPVDIRARMAALELARDANWLRYRFSLFFASGDDRSDPGKAGGFDMITDNPNVAGGQFMFWTQQTSKVATLPNGGILSEKFSLLPNLRSKFTDRANFVNPGLFLIGGGVDMRLTPNLKVVTNVSSLSFANNAVLEQLAGPLGGFEDNGIGLDISVGAKWRPFLNENLFIVPGFSLLSPKGGFKTALGDDASLNSFFVTIQVAY